MTLLTPCTLLLAFACTAVAGTPPELLGDRELQQVFGGETRSISALWHNPGREPLMAQMRVQLFQASSATAAPFAVHPWKRLNILPGQTVLETVALDFPAVNAPTTFFVQWLAGTNRIFGQTGVLVYPTNLLDELKPLLNGADLGVLDPNHILKPSFTQNGVAFLDLDEKAMDDFTGRLAVIGPFDSPSQMRSDLTRAVRKLAQRGTAVVWLPPPPAPGDPVTPSFYFVPEGLAAVVVAQADLVADFSENPRSQLNLIHFCKLALNPVPLALPDFASQP